MIELTKEEIEQEYTICPVFGRINIGKAIKERNEAIEKERRELLPQPIRVDNWIRIRGKTVRFTEQYNNVSCG